MSKEHLRVWTWKPCKVKSLPQYRAQTFLLARDKTNKASKQRDHFHHHHCTQLLLSGTRRQKRREKKVGKKEKKTRITAEEEEKEECVQGQPQITKPGADDY